MAPPKTCPARCSVNSRPEGALSASKAARRQAKPWCFVQSHKLLAGGRFSTRRDPCSLGSRISPPLFFSGLSTAGECEAGDKSRGLHWERAQYTLFVWLVSDNRDQLWTAPFCRVSRGAERAYGLQRTGRGCAAQSRGPRWRGRWRTWCFVAGQVQCFGGVSNGVGLLGVRVSCSPPGPCS